MMWLIPRSDPGALTEYRRRNTGAVSTGHGALLPYGPFARLVMLWMYTECAQAAHVAPPQRDPVSSIKDFLLAIGIEWMDVAALFEQADRLFACRFHAGNQVMPVIEASMLQKARAGAHLPDVASSRGMELAYSDPFRQEMTQRRFEACTHSVRALRHRPFALDVYLWDGCTGSRTPPAPAHSRLSVYHALADHPLPSPGVSDVLAFERDLAAAREELLRLGEQAPPPRKGRPVH